MAKTDQLAYTIKEKNMSETNGYVIASTEVTKAITAAFGQGSTVDEVFAALKVQAEVIQVRLTQAILHQQQVEATQTKLDL